MRIVWLRSLCVWSKVDTIHWPRPTEFDPTCEAPVKFIEFDMNQWLDVRWSWMDGCTTEWLWHSPLESPKLRRVSWQQSLAQAMFFARSDSMNRNESPQAGNHTRVEERQRVLRYRNKGDTTSGTQKQLECWALKNPWTSERLFSILLLLWRLSWEAPSAARRTKSESRDKPQSELTLITDPNGKMLTKYMRWKLYQNFILSHSP